MADDPFMDVKADKIYMPISNTYKYLCYKYYKYNTHACKDLQIENTYLTTFECKDWVRKIQPVGIFQSAAKTFEMKKKCNCTPVEANIHISI